MSGHVSDESMLYGLDVRFGVGMFVREKVDEPFLASSEVKWF